MTAPAPTSRLDAVNSILATLGESPVSSVTAPYSDDVAAALSVLNEIDREVQSRGWAFNRDYDVELVLDVNSKYIVPANAVRITINRTNSFSPDLTIRRDSDSILKLYDKKGKTFVLAAGLKAEIIRLYDFEDTPEVYRRYVTIRAARTFQDRAQRDPQSHAYSERDETVALKNLRQHEGAVDTRTIFDSMAAFRVIDRLYPHAGDGILD